jgi:hypothetical protein
MLGGRNNKQATGSKGFTTTRGGGGDDEEYERRGCHHTTSSMVRTDSNVYAIAVAARGVLRKKMKGVASVIIQSNREAAAC